MGGPELEKFSVLLCFWFCSFSRLLRNSLGKCIYFLGLLVRQSQPRNQKRKKKKKKSMPLNSRRCLNGLRVRAFRSLIHSFGPTQTTMRDAGLAYRGPSSGDLRAPTWSQGILQDDTRMRRNAWCFMLVFVSWDPQMQTHPGLSLNEFPAWRWEALCMAAGQNKN